ncbi:MAG: type II toxin-antitoxin system RatA family toxin [Hyphomicrobiaceae bacterium]|nr:type II toxin-antitoxin system RatA family toxin [Hyphomicrobiaceae bacterium]
MSSFRTTRRMPFTGRQMFDLVADVERYPQFLPMCEALVVRKRWEEGGRPHILADMSVGYGAIRETFTTQVALDAARLSVRAVNPPGQGSGPFKRIENTWAFRDVEGGCEVDFAIAYEFKSFVLQALVGGLFEKVFRKYTEAFEARAHAIYGSPRANV